MANRGMLPKFRPATLGGREVSARPMIRPVRSTSAPPPAGQPDFEEPSTMAAARERVHAIARELPREITPRFQDETHGREEAMHRASPGRRMELDVHYETMPAPEPFPPFGGRTDDHYGDAEPSTKLRGQGDYADPEPPVRAREGSGARERPRKDSASRERKPTHTPVPHYDPAAYEANYPSARREDSNFSQGSNYSAGAGSAGGYARGPGFPPANPAYSPGNASYSQASYPQQGASSYSQAPAAQSYSHAPAAQSYSHAPAAQSYSHAPAAQSYSQGPSYAQPSYSQSPPSYVGAPNYGGGPSYEQSAASAYSQGANGYSAPQDQRGYEPPRDVRDDSYERAREDAARQASPDPNFGSPYARREVAQDPNVPAGFVMGVQPIRAPAPGAMRGGPAHDPVLRTPMMGVPFGQSPPAGTMAASPRAINGAVAPHLRVPTNHPGFRTGPAPAPLMHQAMVEEETSQGSRVGRFAWFVFGAAFGIFFAFFATGFVPRLGKKEEISFPPVAPLPAQPPAATAPPPPPPPVVAATALPSSPAAPPQFARVPAPPPTFAQPAPLAPQAAAPAPTFAQPAPIAQPQAAPGFAPPTFVMPTPVGVAAATPPRARAPRSAAPRRPAAARAAPAPAADDSDSPPPREKAEKPKEKSEGVSDLLNAGLAP